MTNFDDLSIDLLLEICHYLTFTELVHAFFGLQKRLDDAIRDYPVCIHLSKAIDCFDLPASSFQCQSLILSGSDLPLLPTIYSHLNFSSLRNVTFIGMNLLTLYSSIGILPVHQLESITIKRFTWQYYPKDLYRQVWAIIMNAINGDCLRYLHLPYHIRYWNIEKATSDFTALTRATLEYISVSQMLAFMSQTPNLRQFKACLASPHRDIFRCTVILSKLKHLSLILHDEWSLKEIQQLFTLCPSLKYLILKLEANKQTKIIFQPTTWQTLIEEKLPCLIFLRLQLNCITVYPNSKGYNFENEFDQNEYWLQRHPHFQVTIKEIQLKVL